MVHSERPKVCSYQPKKQQCQQYLTLYGVNMTYTLKKSIIQWESVYICICLRPRRGSLSAQCVVLSTTTNSIRHIFLQYQSNVRVSTKINTFTFYNEVGGGSYEMRQRHDDTILVCITR